MVNETVQRMAQTRQQRALTTIEAIITILIIGIMATLVAPFLMNSMEGWLFSVSQAQVNSEHRQALSQFISDVEGATAVTVMTSNTLTLTSGGSSTAYALVDAGNGTYTLERTRSGVTGPLIKNITASGVNFVYFNQGHTETATLSNVSVIMITITTLSSGTTLKTGTSAILNGNGNVVITRT